MPIYWRPGLKGPWVVLVYADPYTRDELDRALTTMLADPISGPPPLRMLVDRRHCLAPSPDFVKHIATFFKAHAERFTGSQIAIVADSDIGFGMARMTELLVEGTGVPCHLHSFREWAEAERWLSVPGASV